MNGEQIIEKLVIIANKNNIRLHDGNLINILRKLSDYDLKNEAEKITLPKPNGFQE